MKARTVANEIFESRPEWACETIGLEDSRFLAELIAEYRPQKLIEIGVASGYSSKLMISVLSRYNYDFRISGVDITPFYYRDKAYRTGQLVYDLSEHEASRFKLVVAESSAYALKAINNRFDFAFIDGNHLHPWPTFDLLSLLPFLEQGSWVVLHDINLNLIPRHKHKNRGPKYVFEHWYGYKRHSSDTIPMMGAIYLNTEPLNYFDKIVDLLFTPGETPIPEEAVHELYDIYADRVSNAAEIKQALSNSM